MKYIRKYNYCNYLIKIYMTAEDCPYVEVIESDVVIEYFGNMAQAEAFIDELEFKSKGFHITQDRVYTNLRVSSEVYTLISEHSVLKPLKDDFNNPLYFLGNSEEKKYLGEILGVDFEHEDWCIDYFKVYYKQEKQE